MPEPGPSSAVIVRLRLPAGLARLRARHDPGAAAGLPAHLTLLFPFLPADECSPTARRALAEVAGTIGAFDVCFAGVGRFPGVVYLVPEPSAPFAGLTEAIAERFPGFPPYGGAYRNVIPHLTVADSAEAPLDAIAAGARRFLPFTRRVSAIEVLVQRAEGRWHSRWRLPLGVRR